MKVSQGKETEETPTTSVCRGISELKKRGTLCTLCGEPMEMDLDGFGWCENPNCPWPRGE